MYARDTAGSRIDEAEAGGARRRDGRGLVSGRVAVLTGFEAAALAVAAALHLSGLVSGRGAPFDADQAGVAEALIGAVLAAAAVVLWRDGVRARTFALCVLGFSIVGFLWGLSITLRGGHLPDIVFHVSVLTLLVASVVTLLRAGRRGRGT